MNGDGGPTVEEQEHAQRILNGAARRAKEYRRSLRRKASAGDAAAQKQLDKRRRPPQPKQRASLSPGGAAPQHPLLTSLPPSPSPNLPLTPMEKGLLLENALICVRMLRALHQTSPYSGTCVESEQPNLWIAAALAVLAGRIDAACAASIFGNIKHYQYYGLVKSKVGMVHIKGRVRAGGESVAELIEGDMEELRDLEEVLEEGEHNRPGIAAVLRTRCEREPCDVLERFAAGWGGDMAAPGRYGPLAPFGGPIPGRVPLPAKPAAPHSTHRSTEGQCEGTTRGGERCKVHKSTLNPDVS